MAGEFGFVFLDKRKAELLEGNQSARVMSVVRGWKAEDICRQAKKAHHNSSRADMFVAKNIKLLIR